MVPSFIYPGTDCGIEPLAAIAVPVTHPHLLVVCVNFGGIGLSRQIFLWSWVAMGQKKRAREDDDDPPADDGHAETFDVDGDDEEEELVPPPPPKPVAAAGTVAPWGNLLQPDDFSQYAPGAICKVILDNFMTYSHCVFNPGPRLNLIIGPNGEWRSGSRDQTRSEGY